MQSRRSSAIESVANVVVGFVLAITSQWVIFPLVGIDVSLGTNLIIGGLFTVTSLLRAYGLRRLFNRWELS